MLRIVVYNKRIANECYHNLCLVHTYIFQSFSVKFEGFVVEWGGTKVHIYSVYVYM